MISHRSPQIIGYKKPTTNDVENRVPGSELAQKCDGDQPTNAGFKLQKGQTRLAASSDKVYQLLAHGRWFSPGTPAAYTTKTGRHDIAEISVHAVVN
jgi:hypothetical protein